MATINKDFKIKSGLIVEGTNATVNGNQILTENASDTYILNLIGGETLVKSVSGNLDVDTAGNLTINEEGLYDNFIASGVATTTDISDAIASEVTRANGAYDVLGSAADAEQAAKTFATGEADAALADANDYTDSSISTEVTNRNSAITTAIGTEVTNRNSAITTAKGEAIDAAEGYTDSAISSEVSRANAAYDAAGAASGALEDANSYTDSAIGTEVTNRNSAIATAKGQAIQDAKDYTDAEVSALVDSAPALLDTLNELAAAIADNPNYATDAANAVAGRVAKAGDTMTGALTLSGAPTLDLHASTKKYVDDQAYLADMSARGYADGVAGDAYDNALADANSYTDTSITNLNLGTTYDAYGAAAGAEEAANLYTDGEITTALTTAQGYATTAQGNAEDYTDTAISTEVTNRNSAITSAVDALSTSDIEEGTNLYFTDSRAKTSAADLLTGASLTNITITGSGAGLTITAENGVADSTTDDLEEGALNLYFTPQRAVDAQNAADITPNSVEIANFRKEEATQQYVSSASTVDVHTFAYPYESAKYLVRVVGFIAGVKHSQLSEILVTIDGNKNIAIMEYGITHTSDAPLASFSARAWTGSSDFTSLTATTAVTGCEIVAAATMLSWND